MTVDKNDIIDCQLSEYVYGQISTKDQYSFYKIAIPFDTDRIMINFDTFHDTMYINTDIKPTQESFQWTLSKENETFIITASELKVESLKGVIFIIGITNHKDYNDSYFKFRIIPQYSDTPNINFISNEQEETCEQTQKEGYCYFIHSINRQEKIENFVLYAYVEDNPTYSLSLYASLYTIPQIDKLKYTNNLTSYLPNKNNHGFDSKGNNFISISDDSLNKYIIIAVSSVLPRKINLLINKHREVKHHENTLLYYKRKKRK